MQGRERETAAVADHRRPRVGSSHEKLAELKAALEPYVRGGLVVAFSGGVDSAFLLWAALDALGPERVLAATASSPVFARRELEAAEELARRMGARHRFVPTGQLEDGQFVLNPPRRCYFCKRGILARLKETARENDLAWIVEGSNVDDQDEYRPGRQAVREAGVRGPLQGIGVRSPLQGIGVRSPLEEAGLTKAEIRALSRCVGLPTWDKPAQTCLATRFPHGVRLTVEKLGRVEAAEAVLREMGFSDLRVRDHADPAVGPIARIEVAADQVSRLAQPQTAARAAAALKDLGYRYVTLDLLGYRRGNLGDPGHDDLAG